MDFTEFREKYSISQDKLHRLVLEAHEYHEFEESERQDFFDWCRSNPEEYGTDETDWEDQFESPERSMREKCVKYFLYLLMDEDE